MSDEVHVANESGFGAFGGRKGTVGSFHDLNSAIGARRRSPAGLLNDDSRLEGTLSEEFSGGSVYRLTNGVGLRYKLYLWAHSILKNHAWR